MYIKSRENSPYVKKNKIKGNIIYKSPKISNKNIAYIFKSNDKKNNDIKKSPIKRYNKLLENSNEKNFSNRRKYIVFRKKVKNDLNNEIRVENFIRKTYPDRIPIENKNISEKFKINNKLNNIYEDVDINENDDDELNIDDNSNNFHFEKSLNSRTLILNKDNIKEIDSNNYIQNPQIIKRNSYVNSNDIERNNKENIYRNKTKKIIYITKAQNENFKKYLQIKLHNDYNTELINKVNKNDYKINNNIMKTDEKKKRNKIIYVDYKVNKNNLSAEHKKRKTKKIKLFEQNDLNTKFKNLTSKEKKLIQYNSNFYGKNNNTFNEEDYFTLKINNGYIKEKRNTCFTLNDTEYDITYEEKAPLDYKLLKMDKKADDVKLNNNTRITLKYNDDINILSPTNSLIKQNLNDNSKLNIKRMKYKTKKIKFKKLELNNAGKIKTNKDAEFIRFNNSNKNNNRIIDNKNKLEICNVSNINIISNKFQINNSNINDNRNIIIIINNNENKNIVQSKNISKENSINNITKNNYNNKNIESNSYDKQTIPKNKNEDLLNKIKKSKNNPKNKKENKNEFSINQNSLNNKNVINKSDKLYINRVITININNTNKNEEKTFKNQIMSNININREKISEKIKENKFTIMKKKHKSKSKTNLYINRINNFTFNNIHKDEINQIKDDLIKSEKTNYLDKKEINNKNFTLNGSEERKGNFDKKTNEQINKIKEKEDKKKINDNKQNLDENIINIKPVIQHSIERKRPVFTLPKDKKRPLSEKKSFKIIHKYYDENFILEDDDEENTIK